MELSKLKKERGFIIAGIEKSRGNPEWRELLRKKLIGVDRKIKAL